MIHHITAICSDAEATTGFYTETLGLRLVKLTVNQDDIGTYHLYFGDRTGKPGTVLTFFPWSYLPKGITGPGMVSAISFAVPMGSLAFWEKRLRGRGIEVISGSRFGIGLISFKDPDGLTLEITESEGKSEWTQGMVPAKHAIIGFAGATLLLHSHERTRALLEQYFMYSLLSHEGTRYLFRSADSRSFIEIDESPMSNPGRQGLGSVHHIAFRAKDETEQDRLRAQVIEDGLSPTPVIDRYYFSSVYFHEPGGVLFEIATDGPGFTVDEPEESLGSKLVLPPMFEAYRKQIEEMLPPFRLTGESSAHA